MPKHALFLWFQSTMLRASAKIAAVNALRLDIAESGSNMRARTCALPFVGSLLRGVSGVLACALITGSSWMCINNSVDKVEGTELV